MFVDDHVTADLSRVEAIIPDLQQADRLVGDDVENKDIQGVVACIDQKPFDDPVVFIQPTTEVVGHQESENGRDGEGEELLEGRAPVHVGREILGEKEDDDGKEQRGP